MEENTQIMYAGTLSTGRWLIPLCKCVLHIVKFLQRVQYEKWEEKNNFAVEKLGNH